MRVLPGVWLPLSCLVLSAINATAQPSINPGGVVNAASYAAGAPVVPGSIAAVFGTFPVNTPAGAAGIPLPTSLGGISVNFGGTVPGPLFYASQLQVNVQVPWELAGQSQTTITAAAGSQTSTTQTVPLAPVSPGIFSMNSKGFGQGAILDTSYHLVDASNPATPGSSFVQIYCTGLGEVTNQPTSGAASPANPLAQTLTTPTVTIGGVPATVLFSGLAPGYVGEYQVNVQVPAAAATGDAVPVAISINGAVSNSVTMAVRAGARSIVSPSGGITLYNNAVPLLFTWNTPVQVAGSGWASGESVAISLHGPLNWPAAAPVDLALGSVTADAGGTISGSLTIPYDNGIVGPSARIPKPGIYEVIATGSASGAVASNTPINLCVSAGQTVGLPINWGIERGGRLGVFPGSFADYSPERADPEWVTVWRQAPVSAYGTIGPNGWSAARQPARITHSDYPGTHYGHDGNFYLTPDPQYQWLVGTANYLANAPAQPAGAPGIIEIEWETLNAGNTSSYGQGNIGLPVWANPTVGDRVFVVGRWVLDAGHPDNGDSTEIHPPRLMATMRERPAAMPTGGARAAQVDIYVSGHGGGANQNDPPGLSELLDQEGWGGGRIKDVLSPADQQKYYAAGPADPTVATLVNQLILQKIGLPLTGPVEQAAGPSAFPWGTPGAEELPINDMDYDFDVPLPPPPPGAASVQMQSITQPQHSTTVNEVVTYTSPVNGLPTIAHVHLPYLGADNGIYAKTLLFGWNVAGSPGSHFRVQINNIQVTDTAGAWQMWADVSGQWTYLTGLAPALLTTKDGQTVTIPSPTYDVYLQPADTIEVYAEGYQVACIDSLFGKLFGQSAYLAGLALITKCGIGDNTDLGGALLSLPPVPASTGQYTVSAVDGNNPPKSHFKMQVSVEYVAGS